MNYAIGDVQGCFFALKKLLSLIQFDPIQDTLWFTGDLVNRGPQSLETLRFIKNLGEKHHVILGNHDLHLLAVAHNAHPGWQEDTLNEILTAPDCNDLIQWLIQKPLLYYDATTGFMMVHAGVAPDWDLQTAQQLAREVENVLVSKSAVEFFQHMYGNTPNLFTPDLVGYDRLRCITNYFTRIRFCYPDGRLELENKSKYGIDLMPWFKIPKRRNAQLKLFLDTGQRWRNDRHAKHICSRYRLRLGICINRITPRR